MTEAAKQPDWRDWKNAETTVHCSNIDDSRWPWRRMLPGHSPILPWLFYHQQWIGGDRITMSPELFAEICKIEPVVGYTFRYFDYTMRIDHIVPTVALLLTRIGLADEVKQFLLKREGLTP